MFFKITIIAQNNLTKIVFKFINQLFKKLYKIELFIYDSILLINYLYKLRLVILCILFLFYHSLKVFIYLFFLLHTFSRYHVKLCIYSIHCIESFHLN